MNQNYKRLARLIEDKTARVAVVGLGYVGLPLALEFSRAGFRVVGVDVSAERVKKVNRGTSYIDDIGDAELKSALKKKRFEATTRPAALGAADAIVICVPTPLSKTRQPDMSYVVSAVEAVGRHLRKGQLVVLESTTYPGTTDEYVRPTLERISKLKAEEDFFIGFSPERVDPANKSFKLSDIPKVVGGVSQRSSALIGAFYGTIFKEIIPVSSARSAEMVKLLENIFRSVNISLVNEMAMVCHALGIDIWEVIAAAKTKPFGFMPFYPGPGIGGHCINIDPMYLAWKARLHGYEPRLVELAQTINDGMPLHVAHRTAQILNVRKKSVKGSNILVLGVSYKRNVRDTRESPTLLIWEELEKEGASLVYHDPHVPSIRVGRRVHRSKPLSRALISAQDLILILTDHDKVNYKEVLRSGKVIFDTRHALGAHGRRNQRIVFL